MSTKKSLALLVRFGFLINALLFYVSCQVSPSLESEDSNLPSLTPTTSDDQTGIESPLPISESVNDASTLENVGSGYCVDVPASANTPALQLVQWSCHDEPNQLFNLSSTSVSGYFNLISQSSGQCVDIYDESQLDGAAVIQYPCNGDDNQMFFLRTTSIGVQIIAKHSQKCIVVQNTSQGSKLIQKSCTIATTDKLFHWNSSQVLPPPLPPPDVPLPGAQSNFTRGTDTARKFGTHEIILKGSLNISNPFDVSATVTFVAPSGKTKVINAFYDGGDIWRARIYVNEIGKWSWQSSSPSNTLLNSNSGIFQAVESTLPGKLRKHPANPKSWMTDNGEDFINLGDTAYWLFDPNKTLWQLFVSDDAKLGITSLRVDTFLILGDTWKNVIWQGTDRTRFNLATFQLIDLRMQWILNNYPGIQLQLKVLPGTDVYAADDDVWVNLPQSTRTQLLRYYVSRLTAYPNVFFEATNDVCQARNVSQCNAPSYANNQALAREVGNYFLANDPWKNLMSHGPASFEPFIFAGESWVSYIALELLHHLPADETSVAAYSNYHVYMEEDEYEQDGHGSPKSPNYYFRRLFWSWLLSGGSANYGGRVGGSYPYVLVPYSMSGSQPWIKEGVNFSYKPLEGLNSAPYIVPYFRKRGIRLSQFSQDDALAVDLNGNVGEARPQVARRLSQEFLVYHPNPTAGTSGQGALVNQSRAAKFSVNLLSGSGTFSTEWYKPTDGATLAGANVQGGLKVIFTAPWTGDVVLRIKKI